MGARAVRRGPYVHLVLPAKIPLALAFSPLGAFASIASFASIAAQAAFAFAFASTVAATATSCGRASAASAWVSHAKDGVAVVLAA